MFEKELKVQGFKLKQERERGEDGVFNGRYTDAFLLGEVAGNLVLVRLASGMRTTVYEAEELAFLDCGVENHECILHYTKIV